MGARVIGLDCGLASFGFAVIQLEPDVTHVLDLGAIKTKPSAKKEKTFASDDTLRRAQEIHHRVDGLIERFDVKAIAAESMSFPRIGKQVMVKACQQLGVAWGIIAAIASSRSLPVVQLSPQALKKAVAGSTTASKEQVQEALAARYGADLFAELNKGDVEHAADALGSVVACLDSDVMRMARLMTRPTVAGTLATLDTIERVRLDPRDIIDPRQSTIDFPVDVRAAGGA